MVRGLRTPVCSPRYEIGWDHFDASMSSYTSPPLSPPFLPFSFAPFPSFSLRLLSKLLLPHCTFVHALSYVRTYAFSYMCLYARARDVRSSEARCCKIRYRPHPVYRSHVCAHGNGVREIAPTVFNAETDFLNRSRYSPTARGITRGREDRARARPLLQRDLTRARVSIRSCFFAPLLFSSNRSIPIRK